MIKEESDMSFIFLQTFSMIDGLLIRVGFNIFYFLILFSS